MSYFKFSLKQLAATVVGAAIFFLLARFLSYPIPVIGGVFLNIKVNLQYAVLVAFAVIFGPICGSLIGLTGHFLTYLSFGDGILWSTIIATVSVGLLSGFIFKPCKIEKGDFDGMDVVRFIICSMLVSLVSWGLVKPFGDIFLYLLPPESSFEQGFISGAGNFIIIVIAGTLLILGYLKTRVKKITPDV